jgi:serine/threonine protein kinase
MIRSKGESAKSEPGMDAGSQADSGPTRGAILKPGTMLGKYRIVRSLGAGGMAAVYEALHTGIGKPVAIKTLRAVANEARAEARFLREAAAASRLDHPHVVDVTDFGTEQGLSYLVMELLRGEDLGALVTREPGKLDPTLVVDVMLAVCAGVFAAHESGVIHRDLKPQNIFLARTPLGELVPKVLDFGISKRVDEDVNASLTNSGALLGTTHYLSPEQVSGKQLDVRSDQYALGVILYEALTGKRPHEGSTAYVVMHSIGEGTFVPPRSLRPEIPAALEGVILRAMSIRPQDRFESVHGLGRALLPLASSKRRVIWADYYERDRPPVSPAAPSMPDPPRPPVNASPVDKGTVAMSGFRGGGRAEATRTRSAPVRRPPAPTRVAMPVPAAAEPDRAAPSEAVVVPRSSASSRKVARAKVEARPSGGLRKAVVIAGLLALGAGGYAAWVDPDIADRIPSGVKASIKRALPSDEAATATATPAPPEEVTPQAPMPTGKRVTLPKDLPTGGPSPLLPNESPASAEGEKPTEGEPPLMPTGTRQYLGEKDFPMSGGLTPPSEEELEALRKEAEAAAQAEAAAAAPASSPPDQSGSPEPAAGVRGPAGGARRLPVPQPRPPTGAAMGAEIRGGNISPYPGGDATMRALRFLNQQQQKKRRDQVWNPDSPPPPPKPRPEPPPQSPRISPTGAPILE